MQTDGKILVAGTADDDFLLLRYEQNGDLDPTFGAGIGYVTTDFSGFSDKGTDLALQPDGKIIVIGSSNGDFGLARYNSDGSLDSEFGEAGLVLTRFDGYYDSGSSVTIQNDGKIVVVGNASSSEHGFSELTVVRYLADGMLDSSFGKDGWVMISFTAVSYYPSQSSGSDIAVQPDGKIVCVGTHQWFEPMPGPPIASNEPTTSGTSTFSPDRPIVRSNLAVVRILTDGQLDTSFNGSGIVTLDFSGRLDYGKAILLLDDGQIVVGGTSQANIALARFDAGGRLDTSFGDGGMVIADTPGGYNDLSDIHQHTGGKIIAIGHSEQSETRSDLLLIRFLADGNRDHSFDDDDGLVLTDFGGRQDYGYAAAIQHDRRILIAGRSDQDLLVARYGELFRGYLPAIELR